MTEAGMVAAEGSEANGIKTSEGVGEVEGVDVDVETSDRQYKFTIMTWVRQASMISGHARPDPFFVSEGFHFYEKDTKYLIVMFSYLCSISAQAYTAYQ
jgi:hypothetical protein